MPAAVTLRMFDPDKTCVLQVQVPSQCPHCKADLNEDGSVVESGWVSYESPCHVVDESNAVAPEGSFEEDFSRVCIHDYVCRNCGFNLTRPKVNQSTQSLRVWRIRRKSDGLFSNGRTTNPKFEPVGKIWTSVKSLHNHLKLFGPQLGIYRDCELVEIDFTQQGEKSVDFTNLSW